jgi:hypothetical protein
MRGAVSFFAGFKLVAAAESPAGSDVATSSSSTAFGSKSPSPSSSVPLSLLLPLPLAPLPAESEDAAEVAGPETEALSAGPGTETEAVPRATADFIARRIRAIATCVG